MLDPEKVKCKTLTYALKTIVTKRLLWIHTIRVEGESMILGESDIDMDEISDHRTVMIECVISNCEFSGNLSISAKYYTKYLQIIIQNIQFKDTTFHLSNVNIQFINTYFFESRIQDKSELWPRQFTELSLKFSRVHFDGSDEHNQPIILTIMYTRNTMVHFEETKITNSIINVNSGWLWLKIDDTIFYDSVTFLNSISLCFAYLQNVTISNQKIVNANKASFTLNSEKLYLEILNSKLENTYGGILVNKTFAGYLESWLMYQNREFSLSKQHKIWLRSCIGRSIFYIKWYRRPELYSCTQFNISVSIRHYERATMQPMVGPFLFKH